MGSRVKDTMRRAAEHVVKHPDTLREVAWHALFQRIAIPIDVISWALQQLPAGRGRPSAISVEAREPALLVRATVVLMKQELQAEAAVHVLDISAGAEELRLRVRVSDLRITATPGTPMAQLLASGALDLAKPARLLTFLPKRPAVLAEAEDDRFELDLLQVPQIRDNRRLRWLLRTLSPMVSVREVRTDHGLLLIGLEPHLAGLAEALQEAVR